MSNTTAVQAIWLFLKQADIELPCDPGGCAILLRGINLEGLKAGTLFLGYLCAQQRYSQEVSGPVRCAITPQWNSTHPGKVKCLHR